MAACHELLSDAPLVVARPGMSTADYSTQTHIVITVITIIILTIDVSMNFAVCGNPRTDK